MEREVLELRTNNTELYIAINEIAAIKFTREDDCALVKISLKNGKKKEAMFKVKNDKQYIQLKKDIVDKFRGSNLNDYLK